MEYLGQFVMIMSCSKCNVKCKHCYISYKGDFSSAELKQIAFDLGKKYNVMINGAEPLVDLEYLEAYPKINQRQILTNGMTLMKEYNKVIDELKKHGIDSVSISYHFDIHDEISKVSKEKIREIFKKLKKDGFNTRVMTTITSKNYQYIDKYCKIAYEMGANAIKFTNFIRQGNATNLDSDLILSKKQKKEFFYQLNEVRKKYDKEQFLIQRCGTFGGDVTREDKHFYCTAGKNLVVITPDKNVYPCVFLAKEGNEIGKYRNGRIELFKELKHDGKKCIACEICNKNDKLLLHY